MNSIASHVRRLMSGLLIAVFALTSGLFPATWAAGQATRAEPDLDAIDSYIEAQMLELRIPGLALGIVQDEQIIYLRGYGIADPSGRSVTPQTPFVLNSISKSFAALAIMQLVEAGHIELDSSVQQYLPWFRVADAAASTQITVRHLLNQTSGLPESASYADLSTPANDGYSLEERVRRLSGTQLNRPVGASFEYTDANYDVLGLIVEKVAGQPYAEYVQEYILAPLAMNRSETTRLAALPHDLAVGYRSWFGFPRPFTKWYAHASLPSGDLISTAEDMTHYVIAHLNQGTYDDVSVLSAQGIADLHEPAVREGDSDKYYGMGWETRSSNDVSVVRHDGTSANYYADVLFDPEGRWGVVILINLNSFNMYGGRIHALSGGILSLLHGQTPPTLPAMHHPIIFPAMIAILAVTGLLSAWMVRRLVLRARSPRGGHRGLAAYLPCLVTLGWGLLLLLVVPQLTYPLTVLRINLPDFGYTVLISGLLSLGWAGAWLLMVIAMKQSDEAPVLREGVVESVRV